MDWVRLAEKAALQTKDAFAAVDEATGVTVDAATWAQLGALAETGTRRGTLGMAQLLAMLARVQRAPEGIHYECVDAHPWVVQCLLVRTGGFVALDVVRTFEKRSPVAAWPDLTPWKRKLADNRERCEAWAKAPKRCRLPARALAAQATTGANDTGLLAAVIAHPDDDTPRLVYADWLEEQGSGQAELIRKQLRLAQTKDWKAHQALEQEIATILDAGWKDYAGATAKYADAKCFVRGFVDAVTMTIPAFEKHGAEVFAAQPVRRLRLKQRKWSPRELERLAAAPAMQQVRSLQIQQVDPRSDPLPLAALANGPGFAKLEELSFFSCGHSPADWQAFFERLNAPRLKVLNTHYNRTSAGLYLGLARNPGLAAFEAIDEYAYTHLDPETKAEGLMHDAVAELAATKRAFKSWKSGNFAHITDAIAGHLYGPNSVCTMEALSLDNVPNLTDAFALKIAASPKAKALKSFSTHNSRVHVKGVQALVQAATQLTELRLVCFDEGVFTQEDWDAVGQALAAVPASHPLKTIELRGSGGPGPAVSEKLKLRYGRWDR